MTASIESLSDLATNLAANLPATGLIFNQWIPIIAGILLVLGIAAIVFTVISRRRLKGTADKNSDEDNAKVTDDGPTDL